MLTIAGGVILGFLGIVAILAALFGLYVVWHMGGGRGGGLVILIAIGLALWTFHYLATAYR